MKIGRSLGLVLRSLLLAFALIVASLGLARFADGPVVFLPGGRLEAGELVDFASVDWEALDALRELEVEIGATGSSRRLRFIVYQGRPYLSCGLACGNELVKRWAYHADRDGRVVLRIDGRRMLARLERVAPDSEEYAVVRRVQSGKFAPDAGIRAAVEERAHAGIFAVGEGVSDRATEGRRLYRIVGRAG